MTLTSKLNLPLHTDLLRIADEIFGEEKRLSGSISSSTNSLNYTKTVDAIEFAVNIAGYDPDTISVDIDEDYVLTIKVDKQDKDKSNTSALIKSLTDREINYKFRLSHIYNFDDITAENKNGLLYIHIPTKKTKEMKKIKIKF